MIDDPSGDIITKKSDATVESTPKDTQPNSGSTDTLLSSDTPADQQFDEEQMTQAEKERSKKREEAHAELLSVCSEKEYDQLITQQFGDSLVHNFLYYTYMPRLSNIYGAWSINQNYKLECLRRTSENRMYSVQKIKDGIIKFVFEKSESGIYIIQNMEYYEDFKIHYNDDNIEYYYDYTILPQDYPGQ